MKTEYDKILDDLLADIKERHSAEKIDDLRVEVKGPAMVGMKREMIFQILDRESQETRDAFFAKHPELTVPYQSRIKRPRSE